jgi:hypothetical protein
MRRTLQLSCAIALAISMLAPFGGSARAKEILANDCLIGIVDADGKQLSGDVSCTDCDPTCDVDGVASANGSCQFKVQGCLNIAQSGCTQRPLKKVKIKTQFKPNEISVSPVSGSTSSVCGSFVNFQVNLKKKGKKKGTRNVVATVTADVKPAGQNKDKDKVRFICQPRPAGEACPTTTTTTLQLSTTTTVGSTTTTTTLPGETTLDFTLSAPSGICGQTQDGAAAKIKDLTCGGLSIGAGGSIVAEGPTPDGSISRYAVDCTVSPCTVSANSTQPTTNVAGPDCTDTGCNFGTPLPIPNPALPTLTTCVHNTFAAPASGTFDKTTGAATLNVSLSSDIYLTGNLAQPCPKCSASGTPASPGSGTCDRGPRATMACKSTSSFGVTRDCPSGGADGGHPCTPGGGACLDGSHVGVIAVNLSPLTTGMATSTDAGGLFCPSQTHTGCFGSGTCRTIIENGTPAGAVTPGVAAPATLASTFCIAATGNGLVDASADLPGPGAVSLPGQFLLH